MSKTDVARSELYIGALYSVIESTNRSHPKPLFVHGRHSDAFIYIIEGGCTYTVEGGDRFSVGAGDVLYLAKDAVYRMDVDEGDYHYIFCDFDLICDTERRSTVYTPANTGDVAQLFRRLYRAYNAHTVGTHAECLSLLYRIYAAVARSVGSAYVGRSSRERVEAVREHIDRNCGGELSVRALAEMAGMSEVHLRKLFHSVFGTAPLAYITSARLERAKQLMQYPFLTLEECATQSGFSSLAYFSRVFRESVGMTPTAYRRTVPKKEV